MGEFILPKYLNAISFQRMANSIPIFSLRSICILYSVYHVILSYRKISLLSLNCHFKEVRFITVHHDSWFPLKNADSIGIIQHHCLLYGLSIAVFIYADILLIWGGNWGKNGVVKRAVKRRPSGYKTIFKLSISCCLMLGKTWLYRSIVMAKLLWPGIVFRVWGLPPCSMYQVAKVSLNACAVKRSIGRPCASNLDSAPLIALFMA